MVCIRIASFLWTRDNIFSNGNKAHMTVRILILGGYGTFGSYIARKLSQEKDLHITIAGRSEKKAKAAAQIVDVSWHIVDINTGLDDALRIVNPHIVIHTCGPFQGQNYHVAEACITYGCHYIDLADGRDFVANISTLDEKAKRNNVAVITGASSVPCLTSALIDHYQHHDFNKIEEIDYAITTAQHTNLGLATTSAIMSYVGKPFFTLENGIMRKVYGWQDLCIKAYPGLGWRLLGNCDIPDLELFPSLYKNLKAIRFRAGAEIPLIHMGLWSLSWLVRTNIIQSLSKYSDTLLKISHWFDRLGSGESGFHMTLRGVDKNNTPLEKTTYIIARSAHGPYIPSAPAILCAKMLARDLLTKRGAFPCVGFISLEQYYNELKSLDIEIINTQSCN